MIEKNLVIFLSGLVYRNLAKPILFQFDAEKVHETILSMGSEMGTDAEVKKIIGALFTSKNSSLRQKVCGLNFPSPIGLAAGFDYEAKLTQILYALGFGFQTVGTITAFPYDGNTRPMLGRLPKSKSLMVNKGFKNLGADKTIRKLDGLSFKIPVGISIGRTNSLVLQTQKQSVDDIVAAFMLFEKSAVPNSYYELNISCPNLMGNITFYPKKNLEELLTEVDRLHLKKPVFVKMPIDKSDKEILEMLDTILKFSPIGVIFGNLQKDHKHPTLNQEEVAKFSAGHFSGKPTFDRSNELIKLAYKKYKKRFVIIGCGGVFNAKDAWEKITSGATLVQMITGLVFEGPQVVAEINHGLAKMVKENGFKNISEAIGTKV